jgi:CHASE2 domain-containing sensor protein
VVEELSPAKGHPATGASPQVEKDSFLRRAVPVLIVVLAFNVVVQFEWFQESFPFIHRAQLHFHRLLCSLIPRPITAKWVRVVEIDDTLHQKLGEPTNREYLARLVRNATRGGALTIALDFKLIAPNGNTQGTDAPERKEENASLLQAIKDSAMGGVPVVVTCWLDRANDQFERKPNIFSDADLPLPDSKGSCAYKGCAQIGNVNLPVDERTVPLLSRTRIDEPCSQSFALATTTAYELAIKRLPGTLQKSNIKRAIEEREFVFGSFIPEAFFQTIRAESLANGDNGALSECRGRIVMVGGKWHSDVGNGEWVDSHPSPVGLMAGVYLHANYVEALLDDRYEREVPVLAGIGFDLIAGGALYFYFHKASTQRGKLLVLAIFLAPLLASYIVFANLNFYLDFILPLGACFVHLLVESTRDYFKLRKSSRLIHGTAGGDSL